MPTLQDIANIAQCSKATVSLALSNHPRISESTKAKIRKIAREVGYLPAEPVEEATSKPVVQRKFIGVLYISENKQLNIGQGFFRETLTGIIQEATRSDCNVVMLEVNGSGDGLTDEELYEKVCSSGVEGIIVISFIHELQGFHLLLDERFPMVFVGNHKIAGRQVRLHTVTTDNHDGGRSAVDFLIRMGHSRIALAMAPTSIERMNGFFSGMRNAGLPASDEDVLRLSNPPVKDGCWETLQKHEYTAILATNVYTGLMVLQYLRSAGKQIPEDMSVVVFDDSTSFLIENPPITVMKQDLESLGTYAVKMLLDLLENPQQLPKQIAISAQLVERGSCAPPKAEQKKARKRV